MAEVVVSPIVDVIFQNLTSLIRGEFSVALGFNNDLEKLSNTLSTIRLVLEDAETKQIKDKATRDWLRKLKEAAYDADGMLDDCALEGLRLQSDSTEQVSDSLACLDFKQIMFRRKMGKKIKGLTKKFYEIADERSKFHLNPLVTESRPDEFSQDRETSSMLTEPLVYGRDGDKERIVETLLCNASSQNDISIYPVVGIGGLGKTTLAQVIYNDTRVVEKFDARIWVCVSEDFGHKRITKMIVQFLSEKNYDLVDLEPLQNQLKRLLNGVKFLLVLDDVWDDDREKWNKLICLLTCGDKGSSVIVTTRLPTVVGSLSNLGTVTDSFTCVINPTHNLSFLLEHDCWSLFKHYAFGMDTEVNSNLLEIGQEIVRKCGGLPLAIKALGSLLNSKREEMWKFVKDSEIWNLEEHGENTILPALRLSYNHLSPVFRQCFSYCSTYPKDYEMEKERLIHQWIGNGFIQSSLRMEVEDIGDGVFNELLRRSFFQEWRENGEGKILCKMHDLMHDLACSVMENECSRLNMGEIRIVPQKVRHVSVIHESSHSLSTLSMLSQSQPFFRTLLFIRSGHTLTLDFLLGCFSQLKCLRVLDLGDLWNLETLPSWIGRLKHLRYLNLSNTGISSLPIFVCCLISLRVLVLSHNANLKALPPSIGNLLLLRCLDLSFTNIRVLPKSVCSLTNLQTLNLHGCHVLQILLREMSNMKSLRHLEVDRHNRYLNGMPVGMGQLTCLQTLKVFVVSPTTNSNREYGAGIHELERLNQLKGELTIKGLRHVCDPRDAKKANLRNKKNLSVLNLLWSGGEDVDASLLEINNKEVLEELQPHHNVQKLSIEGYAAAFFPSWVGDSMVALPKLIDLKFSNMPNLEGWFSEREGREVALLQLPCHLKTLQILNCPRLKLPTLSSSIKSLALERCNDPTLSSVESLPCLSDLCIIGFDEVEILPEEPLRNLTCLQTLVIKHCSKLKCLPTTLENLTTLTSLKIESCRELKSMTQGLENLRSLVNLSIIDCWSLKSLSESSLLQHFACLKSLEINGCPQLEISVLVFQHLVSLRRLTLWNLPNLTSFPEGIQHLSSLHVLVIWNCKNVRRLPEWLRHLPALRSLQMLECHPELRQRCEKDKGEDWTIICHLGLLVH